jgi:hypothetical protein
MKRGILTTAAIFAALMFAVNVQADNTFQPASGDWSDGGNWTGGVPADGDHVVIPDGSTCYVDEDGRADSFAVANGGYLIVEPGQTLAIDSNSTVDQDGGIILQGAGSVLQILVSLTISGDGSIVGQDDEARIDIGADSDGTQRTLTSTITIEGALLIQRTSSATVNMTFTNNGIVEANDTDDQLEISPNVVNGTGQWIVSTDPDAKLLFSVSPTSLSGNVTVSDGTLDIDENFETSGTLTQTGGKIDVEKQNYFQAS